MSAEGTVAEIIEKVGIWWPAADEADLHAAADAWDDFAAALESATGAASAAAATVTSANSGEAIGAFAKHWARYDGGCQSYCPSTAAAARSMARCCRDYADAVADAKDRVRELAIEIGASLAVGLGLAFVTFGATQAAAAGIAAALIRQAAVIGIELSATAATISGSAVAFGAFAAVEAAAVDIAIAQPIRVELHDRAGYSGQQTLQSAAFGGALGGFGGAFSSAAGHVTHIGRVLDDPAGLRSHFAAELAAARTRKFEELCHDYVGQGEKVTPNSVSEAEAAFGVEEVYNLGPMRRPKREEGLRADFVDEHTGVVWDVKRPRSRDILEQEMAEKYLTKGRPVPRLDPRRRISGEFDVAELLTAIRHELNEGENVILDLRSLNPRDLAAVQVALRDAKDIAEGSVIVWPPPTKN